MAYRFGRIALFAMIGVIVAMLSGCGGDSDDMVVITPPETMDDPMADTDDDPMADTDDDPMADMDDDPMADMDDDPMAVGLEGGLTRSPQPPVYADSGQDTLANLLPDGKAVFSPLSASIRLDYGMDRSAQPDQGASYVKSIASDGEGGFHVASVFNGEESRVHLEAGDYSAEFFGFSKRAEDGQAYHFFSSWTDAFWSEEPGSPAATDRTDGSSEFHHFDFGYWLHYEGSDAGTAEGPWALQGESRDSYVTYGARTALLGGYPRAVPPMREG